MRMCEEVVSTYPEDTVTGMVPRPTVHATRVPFPMFAPEIFVAHVEDDIAYVVQTHCAVLGNVSDPLAEPGLVLTLRVQGPRRSSGNHSSWNGLDRAEGVLRADRVRQFPEERV
jgi:hypothetical protein